MRNTNHTIMNKRNFAFGKMNMILLAVGVAIVIIGFFLMSGGNSDEHHFDPAVLSDMRIKIAPVITLVGYLSIIGAILYKPKTNED